MQADYIQLFPHAGIQHKGLGSVQVFGESLAANASAVRRQQARHVANLVVAYATDGGARLNVYDQAGRRLRPASLGDVCILIRSRTGLRILERGLEDAGIPHRIEGGSLLFDTQEVQDLLNCLRAIDDPSDAVSVVAALRSPAFACSDLDLLNWREAGGSWNYLSDAMDNAPAAHSVPHGMAKLREYHQRRHELTVSRLVSKFVRERRLEELDLAEYRPREVWRRRQFLIEQARSLESASAQSSWNLRRFLHWAETQQAESARIAELAVPETDDDAVRIMTMHAAKGLEFSHRNHAGPGFCVPPRPPPPRCSTPIPERCKFPWAAAKRGYKRSATTTSRLWKSGIVWRRKPAWLTSPPRGPGTICW